MPKDGEMVRVHYVGTFESGEEFDASRKRGDEPFSFELGKNKVIRGWDIAVPTMKQGEVARFTFAPEFAYGEKGAGDAVPPNATLVFEIELVGWASKDDLFSDGGAVLTQARPGKGWKEPKMEDEVVISVEIKTEDGGMVEQKSIEYVLGSGAFGTISETIDKALTLMKKEEEVTIKVGKERAYPDRDAGAVIKLALEEMYDVKDVSPDKDRVVLKKTTREGDGWDNPKNNCKVTLKVEAAGCLFWIGLHLNIRTT